MSSMKRKTDYTLSFEITLDDDGQKYSKILPLLSFNMKIAIHSFIEEKRLLLILYSVIITTGSQWNISRII